MLSSLVCINVRRRFSPLGFANYNFIPIMLLPPPRVTHFSSTQSNILKKSFRNIYAVYLIYDLYNNGPLLRESNEFRQQALGKLPECVKTGVNVWVL